MVPKSLSIFLYNSSSSKSFLQTARSGGLTASLKQGFHGHSPPPPIFAATKGGFFSRPSDRIILSQISLVSAILAVKYDDDDHSHIMIMDVPVELA